MAKLAGNANKPLAKPANLNPATAPTPLDRPPGAAIVTTVFRFAPKTRDSLVLALVLVAAASGVARSGTPPRDAALVLAGHVSGPIGPATGIYVDRLLVDASKQNASCLLLTLDTPGGLSDTMREIIQAILASPVP